MSKVYAVFVGRKNGIFNTWDECKVQVDKFPGASYKSYPDHYSAREAIEKFHGGSNPGVIQAPAPAVIESTSKLPLLPFLTVDAAYSHSTKILEWRGVLVDSTNKKVEAFRSNEYKGGSANIGEFIAIVDGLEWLMLNNVEMPIYSDSITAQAWLRNGEHKSTVETSNTLSKRFSDAFSFLKKPDTKEKLKACPINDWKTKLWGEIPADFGRK